MTKYMNIFLMIFSMLGSIMGTMPKSNKIPTTALATDYAVGYSRPFAVQEKAAANSAEDVSLQAFVDSVVNGDPNAVVGIYVPGVLARPVGQQPKENAGFVTRESGKVTQFDLARKYGTVGILAHNDLAGAEFSNIKLNSYAIVVYGDGRLDYYVIRAIEKYQALTPTSTNSDFVNLDGSNERLSASKLFSHVYGPGDRLVFQTCILAHGDPSWGRMFIVATPATSQVLSVVKETSFLLNFASFGLASQ